MVDVVFALPEQLCDSCGEPVERTLRISRGVATLRRYDTGIYETREFRITTWKAMEYLWSLYGQAWDELEPPQAQLRKIEVAMSHLIGTDSRLIRFAKSIR